MRPTTTDSGRDPRATSVPAARSGDHDALDPSVVVDRTVLMVHLDPFVLLSRGLGPADVALRLAGVVLRTDSETCTLLISTVPARVGLVLARIADLEPRDVVMIDSGDRLVMTGGR